MFWNKGRYSKWQKFDLSSPRKFEFFRISSWECSCSDVRLSSLVSLSRALSSLLASELLSWTIVRSPSRWFRVSVASLICALECKKEEILDNTNNYFDEMPIAFNPIWLYIDLIMWFVVLNVQADFFKIRIWAFLYWQHVREKADEKIKWSIKYKYRDCISKCICT